MFDNLLKIKYLRGGGQRELHLPKLYGVWESADDIDFDSLPDKFALKTNHGCGDHLFCRDKNTFNVAEARGKMNKCLKKKFGGYRETQYQYIEPKVYAEELLEDAHHQNPTDYKFMCCDGEVKCCLIVVDRDENGHAGKLVYSKDWTDLRWVRDQYRAKCSVDKPKNYDEMVQIAAALSKNFDHVRVDLYNINGKIYFGELTFTPQGGLLSTFTNEAIDKIGRR